MERGFAALEKAGPLEKEGKTKEAIALYKVRSCLYQSVHSSVREIGRDRQAANALQQCRAETIDKPYMLQNSCPRYQVVGSILCVSKERNRQTEKQTGRRPDELTSGQTEKQGRQVRAGSKQTPQIVSTTNAACNVHLNAMHFCHTYGREQRKREASFCFRSASVSGEKVLRPTTGL